MIDIQTRSILQELHNLSSNNNVTLFVVGGTLRDYILHKNISDIDLTGEDAAQLGTQFAKTLNLSHVPLDKTPGRSTTRIILSQQKHFDLTDMQGITIEEDLSKRDFTINAMGQELSDFLANRKTIIDLHSGKEDLGRAILRATSNNVFQSDPLRMLRAFRFAATMKFSIDEETLNVISQYSKSISKTAGERVWQELLTFFEADNTGESIDVMQRTGLLSCLLSNSIPDWKNFLAHYNRLEHIVSNSELYFPKQFSHIDFTEHALLKLSLLFKSIDKNPFIDDKARKDFGTPKTFETLKALKASNNQIAFICNAIQNAHYFSNSLSVGLNDSSLYDLCVVGGDQLVAGILLEVCTLPFQDNINFAELENLNSYTQLLDFYFTHYLPAFGEKALLNGKDIIRIFKISPSPKLGGLLENIQRAQILGEIKTSEEAEALVAKILKSQE